MSIPLVSPVTLLPGLYPLFIRPSELWSVHFSLDIVAELGHIVISFALTVDHDIDVLT